MGQTESILLPHEALEKNKSFNRVKEGNKEAKWIEENAIKSRWCLEMKKNFITSFNKHATENPEKVSVPIRRWTTVDECGCLSTEAMALPGWKIYGDEKQYADLDIDPYPNKDYDDDVMREKHIVFKNANSED